MLAWHRHYSGYTSSEGDPAVWRKSRYRAPIHVRHLAANAQVSREDLVNPTTFPSSFIYIPEHSLKLRFISRRTSLLASFESRNFHMLSFPVRHHAGLQYRKQYRMQAVILAKPSLRSCRSSRPLTFLQASCSDRTLAGRTWSNQTRNLTVSRQSQEQPKPGLQPLVADDAIILSKQAYSQAKYVGGLRELLRAHGEALRPKESTLSDVALEDALESVAAKRKLGQRYKRAERRLRDTFPGRSLQEVIGELEPIAHFRSGKPEPIVDQSTKEVLRALGLVTGEGQDKQKQVPRPRKSLVRKTGGIRTRIRRLSGTPRGPGRIRKVSSSRLKTPLIRKMGSSNEDNPPALDSSLAHEVTLENFAFEPLEVERSKVPQLSHDLSRVLFNPGVYQLQDPRSRVWNFDPYLGNLMPVSEFNYDALNKYITSSEDATLREVASQHDKRYIGSTSSMSGVLSHFHFLLSAWRELTLDNLSRGFKDDGYQFTKIQRGPTAIFLKYKDGVYAVDADKEFDSANILMSLGRSMEKLLTNDKEEFERYRKTHSAGNGMQVQPSEPEAYHYSELGQFLIRSQLDAHDPRLPGTGMFDLKTRAVAAVRMMVRKHEQGTGYQIKERYGTWESYEREYYDMMRSAFLKYSLQVRMGRMDGIFVAYHNTERLFGFQYIPLSEMDLALHGQTDPTLGDREFRFSVKLLSEIFNAATERFPKQSLRFHFEAREATKLQPPHMYIFAEPVSDAEIVEIQNSKKEEIAAFENRIFNPEKAHVSRRRTEHDAEREEADISESDKEATALPSDAPNGVTEQAPAGRKSNAADVKFLESIMGVDIHEAIKEQVPAKKPASQPEAEPVVNKPLLGWRLNLTNFVNKLPVSRPQDLQETDSWSVQYTLTPFSEAMTQRNYMLCKNRRKTALDAPQDESVRYYVRRLMSMSEEGAEWRRKLDEYDAQRERVVLYNNHLSGDKTDSKKR